MIGIQTATGNHAMDVWMKQQILAPGVEDGEEPDFRAKMLRIGGNAPQGGRAGLKQ